MKAKFLYIVLVLGLFVVCTTTDVQLTSIAMADPEPSLEVIDPGSPVGDTIIITVNATDLENFSWIYLYCDGSQLGVDRTEPLEYNWNTTRFTNDTHTLKAKAYHKVLKEWIESAPIDVTVYNETSDAPSITITNLTDGQTVSGNVTISATVSHPENMTTSDVVYFWIDSTYIWAGWGKGQATLEANWSTEYFEDGTHTVRVTACYREGISRIRCEDSVSVNVDNTTKLNPEVNIDNLEDGQEVSGTVIIQASTTDPANMIAVICYINGEWIGYDAYAPHQFTWHTQDLENGTYNTIKVRSFHSVSRLWYEKEITVFVGNRWYVDDSISVSGDGTSWESAFKYFQDALNNPSVLSGDEIGVAEGTYKPDHDQYNPDGTGNRSATFQLINGVRTYGGFPSGGSTWENRDLVNNQTILNGDLNGDDGPDFTNYSDNSYDVVTGADNAILDGFTIRGANNGSGITCDGTSPTIKRCIIRDNYNSFGAGMYNDSCSPTIINSIFTGNGASTGGGIYNMSSSPIITNCVFAGNTISSYGAGIYNSSSSPTITNCSFTGNTANYGGGIYNYSSSSPIVVNSIFWDNEGGEIYNSSSSPLFSSCDIEGSGGSVNWNSNYGTDGGNNIDSEPYFVNAYDPAGNDTIFYTADDGLKLRYTSPCIDAANGDTAPLTDILGFERIDIDNVPNTGTGTPDYADIGAYETDRDSDEDGLPDDWEIFYGLEPANPDDANYDADSDGLSNLEEYNNGTNPINPDTDSDGMPDGWEVDYGLNPLDSTDAEQDSDSDGLTNLEEYNNSCNPNNPDTDSDTMPDGWEVQYGLNPLIDDTEDDLDSDGLPNLWEFTYGFNPNNPDDASEDTDDDGLTNFEEYNNGCDPTNPDTDNDGLNDGDEVNIHGTNPTNPDSDGDDIPDGWEVNYGLNPLDPSDAGQDPDSDGLTNLEEYNNNCDPANPDTDDDTLNDGDEVDIYDTDPADFDTDNDGLGDGDEINTVGTNPTEYDTDGDFLTDGWEVQYELDPQVADDFDSDADGDGLNMADENTFNSNPNSADTDDDGTDDGTEADQGSDPTDPSDNGQPPPADKVCWISLSVQDEGNSCGLWDEYSEAYALIVGPITHKYAPYGWWPGPTVGEYKQFRPGSRYEVRIEHVGTNPNFWGYPDADYDYGATIYQIDLPVGVQMYIEDPDDILFELHCEHDDPGPNNTFYARNKTAYVSFVEVDLDISGVSDEDEEDTGKYIALNDDDDNNNGIPDKDETGTVSGEDDLVEVTLQKVLPDSFTGPVILSVTGFNSWIKVWESPTKGTQVALTDQWGNSTPKEYTTEELPKSLWVEGVEPSCCYESYEVGLKLTYEVDDFKTCEDNVKFTVVGADLDIDTDNNQDFDDSEEQFEQHFPGKIICLTKEGIGPDLDDLAEIKLDIQPPYLNKGTLTLETSLGDTCIKVWEELSKTTEVVLPKTYDISTTTFPKTLYVDGIEKGKVILDLIYKDITDNEFHRDKVAILITDTISFSPRQEEASYIWSSLPSLGEADGQMFEEQLELQGFDVLWYQDGTGAADNDFQDCSWSNYYWGMKNCGAFCVISHGGPGAHYAVYAEDSSAGQAACDAWRGTEADMRTEWITDGYDYFYTVRVSSKWLAANYASTLNSNKSITFWDICYSATGNPTEGELPVKEAAGGRWRIGYKGPTNEAEATTVNEKFLKRMNGTTDDTKKRTAGKAWDGGNGYTTNAAMDGNDWTTLCPAPMLDADYPVWPDSDPGNRKGWGCVIFDTYMSHTNADDALIKVSGGTTSNHRWAGEPDDFILGFDYDKTDGIATTMRAVGAECRCDGPYYGDGRRMDANRVAPNDTDANPENREWSY
jgi:hypothetical protein